MAGIGAIMRIASTVFPSTPTCRVQCGYKTFHSSRHFGRILLHVAIAQVVVFYEICNVIPRIVFMASEQLVLTHHWSSM